MLRDGCCFDQRNWMKGIAKTVILLVVATGCQILTFLNITDMNPEISAISTYWTFGVSALYAWRSFSLSFNLC
jgi:hypothetical protein